MVRLRSSGDLLLLGSLFFASQAFAHTPSWCGQGTASNPTSHVAENPPGRTTNGSYPLSISPSLAGSILVDCQTPPQTTYSWSGYTFVFAGCTLDRTNATRLVVTRVWDRYVQTGNSSNWTCTPDSPPQLTYSHTYWYATDGVDRGRNDTEKHCEVVAGNPFHVKTGAKYQQETDVKGLLPLVRQYSSSDARSPGSFGLHWKHNYDTRLIRPVFTDGLDPWLFLVRPDGSQVRFVKTAGVWVGPENEPVKVEEALDGAGNTVGYTVQERTLPQETYDAQGRLLTLDARDGLPLSLSYDGQGRLVTVTHATGRALTFTYDAQHRVVQVDHPEGSTKYDVRLSWD